MRTGVKQTGQFHIREGMAFVMQDMRFLAPNGRDINAGAHPWLITSVDEDSVEIVMCTTLKNDHEGKDRMYKLDRDDTIDLQDACPPLDNSEKMVNGLSLSTAFVFPKRQLFTHKLRLLNENTEERNFSTEQKKSLCMSEKELKFIRDDLNEYVRNHKGGEMPDPFHCQEMRGHLEDLEAGYPVPDGFTAKAYDSQFGWKRIKKADPRAVYPKESQMHVYELQNQKVLEIVRKRDGNPEEDDFVRKVATIPKDRLPEKQL